MAVDLPNGTTQRFPLSLQQEFLRQVDHGDEASPFGPRYTIVGGWRLIGPLDTEVLEAALDDLVVRHEALRTSIVHSGDTAYQRVHPPAPVRLQVCDLPGEGVGSRDRLAEELVNEVESGTFDIHQLPLVAAVVGRFDAHDAVLVLAAHHTAVDGWSMQLVVRDLAALYAARRLGRPSGLPEPGQYRDLVEWQRSHADSPGVRAARDFWRRTLDGAAITPLATDRPRGGPVAPTTAWYRFVLPEQVKSSTVELAAATRSSPFMVLLAAYTLLLHRRTGSSDIVASTFTPGRGQAWLLDTVGSFYNFVPLRVNLAGANTFVDLVDRARRTCLAAYKHEIPFLQIIEEAPGLMEPLMGDTAAVGTFQAVQSPHMMADELVGDLRYTAMRRRTLSQPVGSAIPDGALCSLELHASGIVGRIAFVNNLFDTDTMVELTAEYRRLLTKVFADPSQRLARI